MTLIKYILRNESIDIKFLLKALINNTHIILIIILLTFIPATYLVYEKATRLLNINISYSTNNSINILNDEFRDALEHGDLLRQFLKRYTDEMYKSLRKELRSGKTQNEYKFISTDHNTEISMIKISLNLSKTFYKDPKHREKMSQKILSNINQILSNQSKNYLSAKDIDFKLLQKSITIENIDLIDFDKKKMYLNLYSIFIASFLFAIIYVLFTKKK